MMEDSDPRTLGGGKAVPTLGFQSPGLQSARKYISTVSKGLCVLLGYGRPGTVTPS